MEEKKYSRMGRPPAKWIVNLININLDNDSYVDIGGISELLNIPYGTVKSFCTRSKLKSKYDVIDGKITKLIKVKDLKKTAKDHIAAWN